MLHYVCNFAHCGGLHYFVARQFLSHIYALLSVKFSGLKICECKNNDKYQVCLCNKSNVQTEFRQIAFQPPPLKQKDALGELFSPKIGKFFKTAVLTLGMDILQ